jgi:MraZ protein
MNHLFGEYLCKIDAKGRFLLPAGLVRQLDGDDKVKFMVNRGFEKNLTLYPISEWDNITKEMSKLNLYVKKNREFARYFFRGASSVVADGSGRLNIPPQLRDSAKLEKEIVLFAYMNRIEVWSSKLYEETLSDEPHEFSDLAEEVMGRLSNLNQEE